MYFVLYLVAQTSQPVDLPALYGSPTELEAHFPQVAKTGDGFPELVRRKFAAGWNNVFPLALALEHEAQKAFDASDNERAAKYADYARQLAPASVNARLLYCKAKFFSDPFDFGGNFRALASFVRVAFSDYRFIKLAVANAYAIVWVGIAALLLFVLLVIFGHRIAYVAHDFTTIMPRSTPKLFAYMIFVLLLLVPLALRVGAFALLFVLVLLPFAHEETGERVVATIAFLGLAALPMTLPVVTRAWVATDGRAVDLYRVTRGAGADDAVKRLELDVEKRDSVDARAALGLYHKRNGDLAKAKDQLEKAAKLSPLRADVQVNLGAVQFLLGDSDAAEKTFDKAMNLDQSSVPALFNVSRMLYKNSEAERGTQILSRAQTVNPELTNVLGIVARTIGPQFMAEEVPPAKELWSALPYPTESMVAGSAAQAIAPLFVGKVPPLIWLIAAAVFIALAWGFALLLQRYEMALPCPRCGRAISKRTDKDLPDRSLCGQCYHAFVLSDVDTAARIAKEVECLRYERRRAGLVTAATVMLAGTGHLLRGKYYVGFAFLLFAGFAWTLFVFSTATLPVPVRLGINDIPTMGIILAAIVWLISGAWALYSVPKKD